MRLVSHRGPLRERYQLKIEPQAKNFTLFDASAPIYTSGPFGAPEIAPKASAALLALLTPNEFPQLNQVDCDALDPGREQAAAP